jgi:hypothetical protein
MIAARDARARAHPVASPVAQGVRECQTRTRTENVVVL